MRKVCLTWSVETLKHKVVEVTDEEYESLLNPETDDRFFEFEDECTKGDRHYIMESFAIYDADTDMPIAHY